MSEAKKDVNISFSFNIVIFYAVILVHKALWFNVS